MIKSVITGVGSFIPSQIIKNEDFSEHTFLNDDGSRFKHENKVIIEKFQAITGIAERRYADDSDTASDLGFYAAEKAIEDAGIDKNELDCIVVAHNFGDVEKGSIQGDVLPSLASKIKNKLKIFNPNCIAYDILFGCPGWVQGVIQAESYIKSGMASKVLVIGTETLSRVVDDYDRDSMIYADGAGACIIEKKDTTEKGILSCAAQSFTDAELGFLFYGEAYHAQKNDATKYIKMYGRKIYEFALNNVPNAMKSALDKAAIQIDDVKKIFIHQANEKMDEAIIKRFYRLNKKSPPKNIMPMNIYKLGNSSVATVPTLLDMVLKGVMEGHQVAKGDVVIFASVGAGMNINAVVYRF